MKRKAYGVKKERLKLDGGMQKRVDRLLLLVLLYIPLISTLVVFPVMQIFIANGNDTAYYVCYYLYQIIQTCAFFGYFSAIAVVIRRTGHNGDSRIEWFHTGSELLIFAIGEFLVYSLTAVIDSRNTLPFSLCDKSLAQLTDNGGFELFMTFINLVINAIVIIIIATVVSVIFRRVREKRGEGLRYRSYALVSVIVYLAISYFWRIIDTVIAVKDNGIPYGLGNVMYLLLPYAETAIFAVVGYFFMKTVAESVDASSEE